YCERLEISLAEYLKRFGVGARRMLDSERDAPADYNDHLTVAKTFSLAIDGAAKLHSAAEPLIMHAALLAPEPIPLFLLVEVRKKLTRPLAATFPEESLDETIAALLTFALIDRETIVDERDSSLTTECIRLHRLVREVAATRYKPKMRQEVRRSL